MFTISPRHSVLDRMVTLSRAMDEALTATDEPQGNGSRQTYWVPALDSWESEHAFVVQLDLPGVAADQVDISFDRNTLTVTGTRKQTIQAPDNGELRIFFAERAAGSFTRTLRFPQYVMCDGISASFNDGVLTITLPKAESAKPRKISIGASKPSQEVHKSPKEVQA